MQIQHIETAISSYQGPKYSELGQDVLALVTNQKRTGGFFVEFGTMDGIYASNTYLLEKHYQWQGIVCEPGRTFHQDLHNNRRCVIDKRAVSDKSGRSLIFKETEIQLGLSGLVDYFNPRDKHSKRRNSSQGQSYPVDTVSLLDLLDQHNAPEHIEYISVDTEGSELAILGEFDFDRYRVDLWTIEHNYVAEQRQAIQDLMTGQGYMNILCDRSKYDDWYIHQSLISRATQ